MAVEPTTPETIPTRPDEGAPEGPIEPAVQQLPTVEVAEAPPPPYGRSWAFDLGVNEFVRLGARGPRPVYGASTLLQWIDKALHTERGALLIHPDGYGLEDPSSIFGRPIRELSVSEITRRIKDCLTFHPRIADVAGVELVTDEENETAHVVFDVLTDPPLDEAELRRIRFDLGNIL